MKSTVLYWVTMITTILTSFDMFMSVAQYYGAPITAFKNYDNKGTSFIGLIYPTQLIILAIASLILIAGIVIEHLEEVKTV